MFRVIEGKDYLPSVSAGITHTGTWSERRKGKGTKCDIMKGHGLTGFRNYYIEAPRANSRIKTRTLFLFV